MNDGDAETLAAIQARADAATPGPWTHGGDYSGPYIDDDPEPNYWRCWQWDPEAQDVTGLAIVDTTTPEDAEFIAHARTDIPFLLAALSEARSRIEQLVQALEAARPVLAHVSRGAKAAFIDVYPDATARKALGQLMEELDDDC